MSDDEEPKFWVKAVKLVLIVTVVLGLISVGLYYTAEFKTYQPNAESPSTDWGISKDSPIHSNR